MVQRGYRISQCVINRLEDGQPSQARMTISATTLHPRTPYGITTFSSCPVLAAADLDRDCRVKISMMYHGPPCAPSTIAGIARTKKNEFGRRSPNKKCSRATRPIQPAIPSITPATTASRKSRIACSALRPVRLVGTTFHNTEIGGRYSSTHTGAIIQLATLPTRSLVTGSPLRALNHSRAQFPQ